MQYWKINLNLHGKTDLHMDYFSRILEKSIETSLVHFPAVAIIGARQCGKTTMVKHLLADKSNGVYLDLERDADLRKLADAELFFNAYPKNTLFCIDEIQRKPDLFPVLRYLIDSWQENGRFLLLGSASRDLLRQSSESLAGRISYKQLSPFGFQELPANISLAQYMVQGGFPRSVFAPMDISTEWRENFITTFLERDLLQWKNFTPIVMRRLWMMLAHNNGQTVNYSEISKSLAINNGTVKNYIDLLEATFMLFVLPPYVSNMGKRLVKAPKIYIADSGICASLLGINTYETLLGHVALGSIWEQVVIQNIKIAYPEAELFFYRTSNGAEVDIVMRLKNRVFAIECKSTLAPALSKGNYNAIDDIQPEHTFVVCPTSESWPMKPGITVMGLGAIHTMIKGCL
ncbi:MAG TPA: ATP-binding protein [Prolixibacteraceae bacterium]|nr:ATP-binding protein [Prolixibacteraceae bacterium]